MRILYELVTVIREQKPASHWETGKAADAVIFQPGDLPGYCTEKRGFSPFQATSNWLYVKTCMIRCLGAVADDRFILCTDPLPGQHFRCLGKGFFLFC